MSQKVNYNRKPFIVMVCIAAAFLIGAVLCFVVPMLLPKPYCPVEVTSDIKLVYSASYGGYELRGRITNVSDETITIANRGGMTVYCSNSEDNFDSGWYSDRSDIVLEPNGGTYDFSNCQYVLSGGDSKPSVTRVTINIDGTTYYLVGSDSLPVVIAIAFIVLALIFFCVGLTQKQKQKSKAMQNNAVQDLSAQTGEPSYVIAGNLSDKRESKKAAAKNVGMAVGAVFSTLLTGRGVYSVSSGTAAMSFVLSEHSLFTVNSDGSGLTPLTRNELQVASIGIKKNKVIVKSADGNQTFTFFHDKKLPITVEQIAEYLNNIFLAPVQQAPALNETATAVDPFDDVKPAAEAKELNAEVEQPAESAGNGGAIDEDIN